MAAMTEPLRFVETLGAGHPDTLRARIRALALAPDEVQAEMEARARELPLLPESGGYLEDGTPMIRLDYMAAKLGVSLEYALSCLQAFLAHRAAMGVSNAGIVADASLIHRKQ